MKKLAIALACTLAISASTKTFAFDSTSIIPGLMANLEMITGVFDEMAQNGSLDKSGCVTGDNKAIFQDLLQNSFFTDDDYSPELVKLCRSIESKEITVFSWELGITPSGYMSKQMGYKVDMEQDIWTDMKMQEVVMKDLNSNLAKANMKLLSLTLDRKGELVVTKNEKMTKLEMKGIGFNFDTFKLGKITLNKWAMHFSLKSMTLFSNEDIEFSMGLPFFKIPVVAKGNAKDGLTMSILGNSLHFNL